MKVFYFLIVALVVGLLAVFWQHRQLQQQPEPVAKISSQVAALKNTTAIVPITVPTDLSPDVVALGKKLFFEKKLSENNSIACVSCHDLSLGGTDQSPRSIGIYGAVGGINSPTVFNSGLNFRQFWDGRANSLEEQINGPLQDPKEMGTTWATALSKLKQDSEYVRLFNQAYGDGINADNVRNAIAIFERSLVTPNSRFDQFLRGDENSLSALELTGYQRFQSYGCISCHQGVNLGGNMFQKFGIMGDYFAERGNITLADLGRYNVTGREEDKHVFKVPSLRNVALTAPYFHDGSAQTLEEAVQVMLKYQLGRVFEQQDIDALVAFLRTLTGEYNGQAL